MQLEATVTTHKASTRTAIVPGGMTTRGALLRGMPGIDRSDHTTPFFGLVRDKGAHLRKRPTVHTSRCLGLAPYPGTRADIGQVFKNNRCSRLAGLNNLLTQDVIAVSAKPCLLAPEVSQMALSGRRAFALKLALQPKPLALDIFPASLTQEGRGTRDGRAYQAQVYPYDRFGRHQERRWQGDNDVQETNALVSRPGRRCRLESLYIFLRRLAHESAASGVHSCCESRTVRDDQSMRYVLLL